MSLRILITNAWLSGRSGSELYVWDLATALLKRGHTPIVYSPVLGPLADQLRAATIPVVDDLANVATVPDLIHGHHNHELMTSLLHFPGVPAVRVCHGWRDERPQLFPRILRFLCVDHTVRDRVVCEWGVPPAQVQVLLNFVDLSRFRPRPPLPVRPGRALVFSNAAAMHLRTIQAACESVGISVDAVGSSVNNVSAAPEAIIGQYDVVFAKARCALEAMAVGSTVVLCDEVGMGPLVTSVEFERLRSFNFGVRTLREPVTHGGIVRELSRYDHVDAAEVSRKLRSSASLETAVDAIVDVYEEVIAEWRRAKPVDSDHELRAAAAYLRTLGPDHNLKVHTYRLLRELYFRVESVGLLRPILPSRALARRMSASIRRGD
jgi:glycosyltransferase involved in cell wall biosynthesis